MPPAEGNGRLNARAPRLVLGLDVGGTAISAGLVTARGGVEYSRLVTIGTTNVINLLVALTQELCSRGEVRAVGVGVPGAVDARRGIVREVFTLPALSEYRLRARLLRALKPPAKAPTGRDAVRVIIENDVNAMALGELRWGAARGKRDFVLIALGTSVGGAIVLDGKLRGGAHGYAGELGHATVAMDGEACLCGNAGCLRAYASGAAIVAHYGDPALTCPQVIALAQRGDTRAGQALDLAARALGVACVNLIHTLDPELIVVGGSVAQADAVLLKPARNWVKDHCLPGVRSLTPIVRSRLTKATAFLGPAALAWDALAAGRRPAIIRE